MQYWQPIPWISLWHVDTSGTVLWTVFTLMHGCAWCVIYIGTLIMDLGEMLGIKQVRILLLEIICFLPVTILFHSICLNILWNLITDFY
jgi:hypothetical protein